jgi:hypothetical protein
MVRDDEQRTPIRRDHPFSQQRQPGLDFGFRDEIVRLVEHEQAGAVGHRFEYRVENS